MLVATDVLSEGQNLQDCAIVVNYDLPWAIIRLIQRAGRVDRIGQKAEKILCYSFLPADGVERIIRLRARVRQRLQRERRSGRHRRSLLRGRAERPDRPRPVHREGRHPGRRRRHRGGPGLLRLPDLEERHRARSRAAPKIDPGAARRRLLHPQPMRRCPTAPDGVLVYMRTAEGNDALAWVDQEGKSVTESQFAILQAPPNARPTPRPCRARRSTTIWSGRASSTSSQEEKRVGGQLGPPVGRALPHLRAAEALRRQDCKGTLFDHPPRARQGASTKSTAIPLRQIGHGHAQPPAPGRHQRRRSWPSWSSLCARRTACAWSTKRNRCSEPQIICSLGLAAPAELENGT